MVIKTVTTLPEDGALVLKHVRDTSLVFIYENVMHLVAETKRVLRSKNGKNDELYKNEGFVVLLVEV